MVNHVDPEYDVGPVKQKTAAQVRQAREKREKRLAAQKEKRAAMPFDQALVAAKESALSMLDRANRSSRDVSERLQKLGYSPEVTQAAVNRLIEVSIIDDYAFARAVANDRFMLKGVVGVALRQELVRKKIPTEVIDRVCDELDMSNRTQTLHLLVQKKARSFPPGLDEAKKRSRLTAFLARKGYSFSEISSVLTRELLG